MKQIFLLCLFLQSLLSSCSIKSDNSISFIPGTYVRSEISEFGRVEDTITINLQNKDVNSFLIEQRWWYERFLDGEIQEPEYKVIRDQGIYQSDTKLLQNQRNLLFYSFDLENKRLYFGTFIFQKIN